MPRQLGISGIARAFADTRLGQVSLTFIKIVFHSCAVSQLRKLQFLISAINLEVLGIITYLKIPRVKVRAVAATK